MWVCETINQNTSVCGKWEIHWLRDGPHFRSIQQCMLLWNHHLTDTDLYLCHHLFWFLFLFCMPHKSFYSNLNLLHSQCRVLCKGLVFEMSHCLLHTASMICLKYLQLTIFSSTSSSPLSSVPTHFLNTPCFLSLHASNISKFPRCYWRCESRWSFTASKQAECWRISPLFVKCHIKSPYNSLIQ